MNIETTIFAAEVTEDVNIGEWTDEQLVSGFRLAIRHGSVYTEMLRSEIEKRSHLDMTKIVLWGSYPNNTMSVLVDRPTAE